MRILYNANSGKIFYRVRHKDKNIFTHSTNIALDELEIAEVDGNKEIIDELVKDASRPKDEVEYFISDGKLHDSSGEVELATDEERDDLADAISGAISDMQEIVADPPDTTPEFTQAILKVAGIMEKVLKYIEKDL